MRVFVARSLELLSGVDLPDSKCGEVDLKKNRSFLGPTFLRERDDCIDRSLKLLSGVDLPDSKCDEVDLKKNRSFLGQRFLRERDDWPSIPAFASFPNLWIGESLLEHEVHMPDLRK